MENPAKWVKKAYFNVEKAWRAAPISWLGKGSFSRFQALSKGFFSPNWPNAQAA